MKNANKKRGFTIVELVIVIAVVAILAAVLIPTFVGLVDKANVSADEQAVKQMNTVLAADGAVEPTSIFELYNVLSENGFNAKNYSALANNKFFFWVPGTDNDPINRIIYTDGDYNVLYPEDLKDKAANVKATWVSLNGKLASVDAPAIGADGKVTVTTAEEFLALADVMAKGKTVTEITLENKTYNFMGADFLLYGDKDSEDRLVLANALTINGNGAILSGIVKLDTARADVDNDAGVERTYGAALVGYTAGHNVTFKDITIKDSVFGSLSTSMSSVFVAQANGNSKVEFINADIENVTVRGLQKVGSYVAYAPNGEVKIDADSDAKNVTVEASVGLAGGIFGYAGETTAFDIATPANFGDVDVKLNKVATGYYITDNDGKVYGIDLNDDLTMAGTRKDTGLYRYFQATTQYGFVDGGDGDNDVRNAGEFTNSIHEPTTEKVIIAYGATEWGK